MEKANKALVSQLEQTEIKLARAVKIQNKHKHKTNMNKQQQKKNKQTKREYRKRRMYNQNIIPKLLIN